MFKKIRIFLINIWKHSTIRFYILNTIWNYKFWLFSEKIYKNINYDIEVGDYDMDFDYSLKKNKKNIQKKRFAGYFYKGNLYIDNPGFSINDRKTWKSWNKKGLL